MKDSSFTSQFSKRSGRVLQNSACHSCVVLLKCTKLETRTVFKWFQWVGPWVYVPPCEREGGLRNAWPRKRGRTGFRRCKVLHSGERRNEFDTIRRQCFPLQAENGEKNEGFIQASFSQNLGGGKKMFFSHSGITTFINLRRVSQFTKIQTKWNPKKKVYIQAVHLNVSNVKLGFSKLFQAQRDVNSGGSSIPFTIQAAGLFLVEWRFCEFWKSAVQILCVFEISGSKKAEQVLILRLFVEQKKWGVSQKMLTKDLILVFWEHIPMFLTRYINLQTCLIFLLLLLVAKTFNLHHLHVGLPPGPSGVPVLGYLPYLTKNIHLQLTDLAKQFGSIYKLYFGRHLVVVLSDPKVIREAFKKEAFSGRPNTQFTKLLDGYGEFLLSNQFNHYGFDTNPFCFSFSEK